MHSSFLNLSETVNLWGDVFRTASLQNDLKRSLCLNDQYIYLHTSQSTSVHRMIQQIIHMVILLSTGFHSSEEREEGDLCIMV